MKCLFHLALFSIVFSCSNQRTSLTEEPTVNAIFTTQEVKDLIIILDFFKIKSANFRKSKFIIATKAFF